MGLIKMAVVSGACGLAGVYSYRSVTRVNQVVQSIKVPNYTLLGKRKNQDNIREYKDAYSIELPRQFKLVKGTGSNKEISATDVARAFFTCKVFSRFEKPILTRLCRDKRLANTDLVDTQLLGYKSFKFVEGDKVIVWTVIERDLNEILFEWEAGGIKGTTWFCVPVRDNVIYFGSSFPRPQPHSEIPTVDDFISSKPKQLFIDVATNLPPPDHPIPLSDKIRNFFTKLLFRTSVPIHQLYSKYLLKSTLEKLMEMKDGQEIEVNRNKPELFFKNDR